MQITKFILLANTNLIQLTNILLTLRQDYIIMQTLSEENYLKVIYHIDKLGQKVTPTAIAEGLNNNPASVVDMLRKLVEKKLIQYDKVKGAKLTDKGRNIAIAIVRKHRLWEAFLLDKLGYGWDEIHDIAE
jgi:DtxR family transcriptional regulator, Mn-dependent transcriptional regulator